MGRKRKKLKSKTIEFPQLKLLVENMFKIKAELKRREEILGILTMELEPNGLFKVVVNDYVNRNVYEYTILPSLRFDLQMYKEFFKLCKIFGINYPSVVILGVLDFCSSGGKLPIVFVDSELQEDLKLRLMTMSAIKKMKGDEKMKSKEETIWEVLKQISEVPHRHSFFREDFELKFDLEKGEWYITKVITKKRIYTPEEFEKTVKEAIEKAKEITIKLGDLDKKTICEVCGKKVKYRFLIKHLEGHLEDMRNVLQTKVDICNQNMIELDFVNKLANLELKYNTIVDISNFDIIYNPNEESEEIIIDNEEFEKEHCIGKVYVYGKALFIEGSVDDCIEQIEYALRKWRRK